MDYLKQQGFRVIALRDVGNNICQKLSPMIRSSQKSLAIGDPPPKMVLPTEMAATRADLDYWAQRHDSLSSLHMGGGSWRRLQASQRECFEKPRSGDGARREFRRLNPTRMEKLIRAMPYPGGRHPPELDSWKGAICPGCRMRGTAGQRFPSAMGSGQLCGY